MEYGMWKEEGILFSFNVEFMFVLRSSHNLIRHEHSQAETVSPTRTV